MKSKLTPARVQRFVDAKECAFDKAMDGLMNDVAIHFVHPFCDKTGYRFRPGMGSWCFIHDKKEPIYSHENKQALPKRLLKMLTINHPLYQQDIGSLMSEYTP